MTDLEKAIYKIVINVFDEYKSEDKNNVLTLKDAEKILERYSNKEYLRKGEAAKYLGVSVGTFWNWRTEKKYKIKSYTIDGVTLYKKSDLDQFIEEKAIVSNI